MTNTKGKITLFICLVLSFVMMFVLSSCGNTETPPNDSTSNTETSTDSSVNSGKDDSSTNTDDTVSDTPHVHAYSEFVTTKEPTCTEEGEKTKTCSCGDTITDTIEATGHTEETIEGKSPTCKEAGLSEGKKCTICGETTVKQEIIKTNGHSFVNNVCGVCGEQKVSEGLEYAYRTTNGEGYYEVVGIGDCKDTDLIIPSKYNGLPVLVIGVKAFYQSDQLRSVVIPDGVTTIGETAFSSASIIDITIPDSVTFMGDSAFSNCAMLKLNSYENGYYIGNENNPYLVLMKAKNNAISSISVHNKTKFIHSLALSDCKSITRITIPEGLLSIGYGAFKGCVNVKSISLPNSLTYCGMTIFGIPSDYNDSANEWEDIYTIEGNLCYLGNSDNPYLVLIHSRYSGVKITINPKTKVIARNSLLQYTNDSLDIPDSVMFLCGSICTDTSLSKVINIGSELVSMDETTFDKFNYLESVNVSSNNKNYSSKDGVLYNKDKTELIRYPKNKTDLTTFTVPETCKKICDYAFSGCSSLTNITIPSSVKEIGNNAFSGCSALESIEIPIGISTIGTYAFQNCKKITNIVIPEGVTTIGSGAFSGCSALTSITIPSSVKSIKSGAFRMCNALTSINYLGTIGDWCGMEFEGSGRFNVSTPLVNGAILYIDNKQVTDVVIPNTITKINDLVFYNYTSLKSITIPETVKEIGKDAFNGCTSLVKMNYLGGVEDWCNITFVNSYSNPIYYIKGLYINNELVTDIVIPNTAIKISEYAFYNCESLKSIEILNGMTYIGGSAFYNCKALTSVTIPEGVTYIGGSAFYNCKALTSVTIPEGITYIGGSAFYGAPLKYNEYDNGQYIGNENNPYLVFMNAKDKATITSVTIHNDTKIIYSNAFNGCTALNNITLPNDIIYIGDYAFSNCTNLTSVTMPNGVTAIGAGAFNMCSSLKSINIPTSVTAIGSRAFYDCTALSVNAYGNGCYIGNENNPYLVLVWAKNDSITSCTVHDDTRFILDLAFSKCQSLTSLTIPKNVISVGDSQFATLSTVIVYCEAERLPNSWSANWCDSGAIVFWGMQAEE